MRSTRIVRATSCRTITKIIDYCTLLRYELILVIPKGQFLSSDFVDTRQTARV